MATSSGVSGANSTLRERVRRPSTIDTGTRAPSELVVQSVAISSDQAEGTDRPVASSMRRIRRRSGLSGTSTSRDSRIRCGRSTRIRRLDGPSDTM
ncbi:MAG: hypothetical protein L3J91_04370, partial [Thermoplasmata archaeon]|nr:hypothetical protein [Thermoplasmata archaeon]